MRTARDDVEAVKAAIHAYGEHLMVKCPSCGAELGQRCVTVGGTAQRRLDAPHLTRRKVAEGRLDGAILAR